MRKDWKKVLIENRGKTAREIADAIGESPAAVSNAAKRHEIILKESKRGPAPKHDWEKILQENTKKTALQIATMYGVTAQYITQLRSLYR